MLPTFIIAGVAKAGTTSLWEYLNIHPQIRMAPLKEPGFFTNAKGCGNRPDPRSPRFSGRYAKGLTWYESLFRECNGAKAVGEASVMYMPEPDAPGLIKKHLPDVQLLFLLRDPVERIYSHYWQEKRHGWDLPDFADMVHHRHPTLLRYIYVSSYQLHLERYLATFSRAQITVLLYDDLRSNPREFIRQVYQALGVEAEFIPPNLGIRYNQANLPRSPLFNRFARYRATHEWKISQHDRLFKAIRPFGRFLADITSTNDTITSLPTEIRAMLVAEMEPAIAYTEHLLERDLSLWRMVAAAPEYWN
jgi:hypothetical protein